MASVGPNSPATEAQDTSAGSTAWGSYTQALTSNNVRDSVVLASAALSYYIKVTNFSFSLPAGAAVTGVKVEVEGYYSVTPNRTRWNVRLVKGGTIQGNTNLVGIPSSEAYSSVGGDGDMWALTLADTDVEASNFGCVVLADDQLAGGGTAFCDHIRITVYYTTITGTAAATLPSLTAAASGKQTHAGTAAATLPSITASASGKQTHAGTAAATLPSLTAVATGLIPITGTAAATLPSLTAAASGKQTHTGTATATLPSLTAAASGKQTYAGTAAVTLPSLTATATGKQTHSGTASCTLPSLTASAEGFLNKLTISLTGSAATAIGITGSAAVAISLTGSAATAIAVTGSADVSQGITGSDGANIALGGKVG